MKDIRYQRAGTRRQSRAKSGNTRGSVEREDTGKMEFGEFEPKRPA
jgi:hypothetical protein